MKKDILIVKRRKPVDAASMSTLLPGLGQIYCGDIWRGILWMGASFSLLALAVVTLLHNSTRAGFSNTIGLLALDLLLCIVCAMHAWSLAKRVGADYQLKKIQSLVGVCSVSAHGCVWFGIGTCIRASRACGAVFCHSHEVHGTADPIG